jgi:hypothetical protein
MNMLLDVQGSGAVELMLVVAMLDVCLEACR